MILLDLVHLYFTTKILQAGVFEVLLAFLKFWNTRLRFRSPKNTRSWIFEGLKFRTFLEGIRPQWMQEWMIPWLHWPMYDVCINNHEITGWKLHIKNTHIHILYIFARVFTDGLFPLFHLFCHLDITFRGWESVVISPASTWSLHTARIGTNTLVAPGVCKIFLVFDSIDPTSNLERMIQ